VLRPPAPSTGAGGLAGDVKEVLDGYDSAVQRPKRNSEARPRVGSIGGHARGIGIHRRARAASFARRIGNTVQDFLKSVAGG
jgi:hypothetical protein